MQKTICSKYWMCGLAIILWTKNCSSFSTPNPSNLSTLEANSPITFPPLPSRPSQKVNIIKKSKKSSFDAMSQSDLMRFFLRCMKLIQTSYVDEVSTATLIEGAIQGMLNATDPHSVYFNESDYNRLQEQCKGSFGGLGVVITSDRLGVRVISCLDDTPAAKVGILPGDIIVAINDIVIDSSDGISTVSELMRGSPGSVVKLSIERKGQEKLIYFTLKRAIISVKSVKYHIDNDIAVIRIANFDEQTPELLKKAIENIQDQKKDHLRGYVIDLRRNPGGLVDSAVNCCQFFIERGILLRSKGRLGSPEEIKYAIPGLAIVKNKPIVVLIDEGSASASEMMAGALQDHKVAIVLGIRSFGKGSTQAVIPLDPEKTGAVKVTNSRWYKPLGEPIQGQGICPDIVVERLEKEALKSEDANKSVFREGNFFRALSNENLKDKKNLEEAPSAAGSSDKEGKKTETSNTSNPTTDLKSNEKEFDYQLLRAMDVITALYIYQKK